MFKVIGIMFLGVGLGYLLRKVKGMGKISLSISGTILLLLFLLGVSVGTNKEIVRNLGALGSQALLFALAGTLGSIIFASVLYQYFFKNRESDEK